MAVSVIGYIMPLFIRSLDNFGMCFYRFADYEKEAFTFSVFKYPNFGVTSVFGPLSKVK